MSEGLQTIRRDSGLTENMNNPIKEAQAVLLDEANELSCLTTKPLWAELPHRAKVAIQNEVQRLKRVAEEIGAAAPAPEHSTTAITDPGETSTSN